MNQDKLEHLEEQLKSAWKDPVSPPEHLTERLFQRVTQSMPARSWIENLWQWLSIAPWRPLTVATLPLVAGIAIGALWGGEVAVLEPQTLLLAENLDTLVGGWDTQLNPEGMDLDAEADQ